MGSEMCIRDRPHAADDRFKRRQRFALVENGDAVSLLPWMMAYTRRGGARQRDAAQEASKEAQLERASSACRHTGGVKVASRTLRAESRSARNEKTLAMLGVKFQPEDHTADSAAAAAAVLAGATNVDGVSEAPQSQNDEYAFQMRFHIIISRSARSGCGK